jgi:hypothetical protein
VFVVTVTVVVVVVVVSDGDDGREQVTDVLQVHIMSPSLLLLFRPTTL